ncbi:cytokine receptor family member b1 [Siphateles boraxobius]|uniref:cytokine receptor family member b1 n=1 Tax=Siphateles boraxobius TaxID=180520 RepID=UPI004062AB2A
MTTAYVCHLFLMSFYITVLHTIPAPDNLTIVSHNFRHILQWNPGIGSPPRTVFNFKVNDSCSKGKSRVCLNTTNTSVDVSDHVKKIYSRCTFTVWASLDNTTSRKVRKSFTPYEDTIIGPPVVSLSGCGNCLNIGISLADETTITEQMIQFYRSASFNISWKKAGNSEAELISTKEKQTVLQNLQPGHQYCVRVLPEFISNPNTRASAWQCEYTSKVEPRGGLYVMSWSLGASVSGVAVLLLVFSLVYTGFLCKLKTRAPQSLSRMVQAHYLIPEETLCERVSSGAPLNSASKAYPSSSALNEEDSGNKQHEDNYANEADTDDEEDYEEEEKGNYMGCVSEDSGLGTNSSKEKAVVSTLHGRSRHFTGEAKEETHHDEHERRNKLISEVFDRHNNTHSESKGNEDGSGNINLFSVTLRTLGLQDEEEELCKPLLLESVLGWCPSDDSEHTEEEEEEEEELPLEATPAEMSSEEEEESPSGYMLTHTGNMD